MTRGENSFTMVFIKLSLPPIANFRQLPPTFFDTPRIRLYSRVVLWSLENWSGVFCFVCGLLDSGAPSRNQSEFWEPPLSPPEILVPPHARSPKKQHI